MSWIENSFKNAASKIGKYMSGEINEDGSLKTCSTASDCVLSSSNQSSNNLYLYRKNDGAAVNKELTTSAIKGMECIPTGSGSDKGFCSMPEPPPASVDSSKALSIHCDIATYGKTMKSFSIL